MWPFRRHRHPLAARVEALADRQLELTLAAQELQCDIQERQIRLARAALDQTEKMESVPFEAGDLVCWRVDPEQSGMVAGIGYWRGEAWVAVLTGGRLISVLPDQLMPVQERDQLQAERSLQAIMQRHAVEKGDRGMFEGYRPKAP